MPERPNPFLLFPEPGSPSTRIETVQKPVIPQNPSDLILGEQPSPDSVPGSFQVQEHDPVKRQLILQPLIKAASENKKTIAIITGAAGIVFGFIGAAWMLNHLRGRKGVEFIEPPLE